MLLLGPRIRQRFSEARDGEIRWRRAINDGRDDARRNEGEGSQQTNVTFGLTFPFGDLGEGGSSAEPNVLDPSSGLVDCRKQSITALGLIAGFEEGA